MSPLAAQGLLVAAGAVAGVVGTAGGITSLVSYPALLAVGLPPLQANVANLVALVACWPGSALTSRRELAGTRRWLARALPIAALGAAGGALLLLGTPPGVFRLVVPWLVAGGSVALLLQPRLTARFAASHRGGTAVGWLGLAAVSVYSGYFGAGAGVLLLALLLVVVDARLPRANARKNMLNGASTLAAAVLLASVGPVAWPRVLPLAIGLFAGSTAGPVVARRVPARVVRWVVAALGFGLAVRLALGGG